MKKKIKKLKLNLKNINCESRRDAYKVPYHFGIFFKKIKNKN